jgi:murein DD-endopeptidase MepM/ murein hydrolase activator NlpD
VINHSNENRDAAAWKQPDPSSTALAIHLRWLLLGLLIPLIGGAIAYWLTRPQATPPTATPVEITKDLSLSARALPESPIPTQIAPLGETVKFVVRRNDTLDQIFRQLKLSLQDLALIRGLPGVKKSLDVLKPGELITVVHTDGSLKTLTRQISDSQLLSVTRGDDGFSAEVVATPLDVKTVTGHGKIESSLFNSGRDAGISADLIMRLANDIFGWDIDFALDIQPGDEFSIIYEKKYRDGQYLGDGRILAAEFINEGHIYRAVHFDFPDGKSDGYYTPEGRSMHKQFLRAPVDFTRISSGFTLRRFHPILNIIRAHKGVDYAAPTGTAIKAAGDGRVSFIGIQGGYGRVIILDHGNSITTLYGHMSRFAPSLRVGNRVSQGQTIGFVGQSGAATGPHLHYEYRINGTHKDPRTVPLPAALPIPHEYLTDFQQHADPLLSQLDRARDSAVAATATAR